MKLPCIVPVVVAALASALPTLSCHAAVEAGYLDGLVNVQKREPAKVTNEFGNDFFPGHKLTIRLDGSVDINWSAQWEQECFLTFCNTRRWINHNWKTPAQWPVLFHLVDDNGVVKFSFNSQNGVATFTVPFSAPLAETFNKRLSLVAAHIEGTPPIDPSRSQGQFTARVSVDASERALRLPQFLSEARPTARDLKPVWGRDPFMTRFQGSRVAAALAGHARTNFPPANALTAAEHRELLEYAADIEPNNLGVTSAIADMYMQQGNPHGAEDTYIKKIKDIRQRPGSANNPRDQIDLARTYAQLAATMEAGVIDGKSRAAIVANYTAAIDIASRFRAPVIVAESLYARGAMSRGANTPDALRSAQNDFRRARDESPRRLAGLPVSASPGLQELLVNETGPKSLVTWKPLVGTTAQPIRVDAGEVTLRPLAVAESGRVLAASNDVLGWINLADASPAFEVIGKFSGIAGYSMTNGRLSIVTTVPTHAAQPVQAMLLRDTRSPYDVKVDNAPPLAVAIASQAQRYVVLAASGQAIELRQSDDSGDALVRRIAVNGALLPVRIAPSGRRIAALVQPPPGPGGTFVRKLVVWSEDGTASEVRSTAFAPAPPPGAIRPMRPTLPADMVVHAEFTGTGDALLVVLGDGRLGRMAAKANAPVEVIDVPASEKVSEPAVVGSMARISIRTMMIVGRDARGLFQQFVNLDNGAVRLVRPDIADTMDFTVGLWEDSAQRIGLVQQARAPMKLRSIRTADASSIGETVIPAENAPGMPLLLRGGKFVCISGVDVTLRNITDHSETVIRAARDGPAFGRVMLPMSPGERTFGRGEPPVIPESPEAITCVPRLEADMWDLVKHRFGKITSVVRYKGHEAFGPANVLPDVPTDIADLEKASAQRLNHPYQAPAFTLPAFLGLQGLQTDPAEGRLFAAAMPTVAMLEATNKPLSWVSIPYIMLNDKQLVVRRMRVPLGAVPIKVLPSPTDKVIYAYGGKILWKPLTSETPGKTLIETKSPPAPLLWVQFQVNATATRLVVSGYLPSPPNSTDVEQRVFDITENDIKPKVCSICARRTVSMPEILANGAAASIPAGLVQVDPGLDRLVAYDRDFAWVYDLNEGSVSGALPMQPVFWIGPDRVFYRTGNNEFSVMSF